MINLEEKTPVELIQEYLEKSMATNENSVYDLKQFIIETREREKELLEKFYTTGFGQGFNYAMDQTEKDIADHLDEFTCKHLQALDVVNTYNKENEYLIGFKQAILMMREEFKYLLEVINHIDIDEDEDQESN